MSEKKGKIKQLEERIETLEKEKANLKKWVAYGITIVLSALIIGYALTQFGMWLKDTAIPNFNSYWSGLTPVQQATQTGFTWGIFLSIVWWGSCKIFWKHNQW